MHHARLPDPGVAVDAQKAQLLLYVRRAVWTFQHRYTALPTPVGDARIAGPVVNQHLDMPPGEVVRIDLIPETTQQSEGAEEGTSPFVHGFIRYVFGLASVLAVVLVNLVLKLAFPIRVVAHSSLSTGQASKGDRHTVRKLRQGARAAAAGAADE